MLSTKFAVATALIAAALSVSAAPVEVGATVGKDFGQGRNAFGLSVGMAVAGYGVTAGVDRSFSGANDQTRYSLVGSREVAKFGPVAVAAKAGVAYVDNQDARNGTALLAGVGASYSLAPKTSLTTDVTYQRGQSAIADSNGVRLAVGVKQAF